MSHNVITPPAIIRTTLALVGPQGAPGVVPALSIAASEAISAGAPVNIWDNAGIAAVRNASAASAGLEAHGYVLGAVAPTAVAQVYTVGVNSALSGLTPGIAFLGVSPGTVQSTAPSGSGQVIQRIGEAISATAMTFYPGIPIGLA